jgi:hypothetical protein
MAAESPQQKERILDELDAAERLLERRCPGTADLVRIVHLLNDTERGAGLRKLVEKWQSSGPNLENLFASPTPVPTPTGTSAAEIRATTEREWKEKLKRQNEEYVRLRQEEESQNNAKLWRELQSSLRLDLQLTTTGKANVRFMRQPHPQPGQSQEGQTALWYFALLITNPRWAFLGGPCRRCGRYYIKKTKRMKRVYCYGECKPAAQKDSAVSCTRKKRRKEYDAKVKLAKRCIHDCGVRWGEKDDRKLWKKQVQAYALAKYRKQITPQFLTRAVGRGDLKIPSKGRSGWRS